MGYGTPDPTEIDPSPDSSKASGGAAAAEAATVAGSGPRLEYEVGGAAAARADAETDTDGDGTVDYLDDDDDGDGIADEDELVAEATIDDDLVVAGVAAAGLADDRYALTNRFIFNGEEVTITSMLRSENFLFIDENTDADGELSFYLGGISKFYFVYGLLVDINTSSNPPKYVFRLYENFRDLELEVGSFVNTPPEEFSASGGLFQDMSQFGNDAIIVGRFERTIKADGTEYYDEEYLIYDKTSKKFDGATAGRGGGLWLSQPSRILFNYKFNVTQQGARKILTSCVSAIRDNFKIARTKDTQYDFKFCESQQPEISGEQVITISSTPTETTTATAPATSGGGGGSGTGYYGG